MTRYQVKLLRPGVSFTKPVYIDPTNMLAAANVIVTQSDIDRLVKWKIEEVLSEGEPVYANKKDESAFMDGQQKIDIENIKRELKNLLRAKPGFNNLTEASEAILKNFYERVNQNNNPVTNDVRNKAEEITNFVTDNPLLVIYVLQYIIETSTYKHVIACAIYSVRLGLALDFSRPKIVELVFAILMMDVGMLKVPSTIIEKKEKLNETELQIIHAHTVHGYQMLTQTAKIKNSIASVALQHHEHFDGSGYPRKIKGAEMAEYARVASILDSFCAIISEKPYRKNRLPYEAMKELLTLGIYRYDPIYLKTFLDSQAIYPLGSIVELSDGSTGMVVMASKGKPMRPVVWILRDAKNQRPKQLEFVHLLYTTDKFISRAKYPQDADLNLDLEFTQLSKLL
ncbi:MAG TPA: HD domain-containing phosphohydrolase [Turneriella sp.]|nr:HD domain-containing phosphohydrolase [Turneriella sp.]